MSAQDKPETCETCRFWPVAGERPGGGWWGIGGYGCNGSVSDCRRRAPISADPRAELSGSAIWPTTKREAWCGDWESRPALPPGEQAP